MKLSTKELSMLLDAVDLLEADWMREYPGGHEDQTLLDALTVKLRAEYRVAKQEEKDDEQIRRPQSHHY